MRILTWNINSVRLRIGLLEKLAEEARPDIVCLQETKTPDEKFPVDAVRKIGFPHMHYRGEKGYNGVAILSKLPLETPRHKHWCDKEDTRHIAVDIRVPGVEQPVEIHNFYVPAGGDEPDPDVNVKFAHKLQFVEEMERWFDADHDAGKPMILVGDLNIAPLENDVWSHKQLLKVVSHTPPETERLSRARDVINWVDAIRHFKPEPERVYTWWSYRNRDWKKSNRGRRLDHIWVTEPLKDHMKGVDILQHARDWEKPSDHVPVILDIA